MRPERALPRHTSGHFSQSLIHIGSYLTCIVPPVGFEPTTQGLKDPCSTVELKRRVMIFISSRLFFEAPDGAFFARIQRDLFQLACFVIKHDYDDVFIILFIY